MCRIFFYFKLALDYSQGIIHLLIYGGEKIIKTKAICFPTLDHVLWIFFLFYFLFRFIFEGTKQDLIVLCSVVT